MGGISAVLVKIGRSVGGVVGTLYQAGRDTVDTVIRNVIPFMAFISFIICLIQDLNESHSMKIRNMFYKVLEKKYYI